MATFLVASNWAHPNHGTSHVGPGRLVPWVHAPASLAKTNGTMGTACVTLLGMVAVTKRSRARVLRRAQRPINARDGKTIPQGGSWLFPAIDDDELYEEMENELPPKKSLEDSVYCCWVTPKKKASELFESWADDEAADDEQKNLLLNLSNTEMKKGWTIWGLTHKDKDREPGFYIVPPCEADCLVVVEAVDEDKNNIQHLAVRPSKIGKETKQAFLDWIDSLRPKVVVVKRPPELYAFGLGVDGDGKGTSMGDGPKVSKGL